MKGNIILSHSDKYKKIRLEKDKTVKQPVPLICLIVMVIIPSWYGNDEHQIDKLDTSWPGRQIYDISKTPPNYDLQDSQV